MNKKRLASARIIEALYDAITTYECHSYEEIADASGLSVPEVSRGLTCIRQPAKAKEWGFTVPHVSRGNAGPRARVYQVVHEGESGTLSEDERASVQEGALATLRGVVSTCEAESYALSSAAQHMPTAIASQVRQLVKVLDGAGAMARGSVDSLYLEVKTRQKAQIEAASSA